MTPNNQPTFSITADTSRFDAAYERALDKMPQRDQWLTQIRSNPSDWKSMLVFADWLELDNGDLLAAEQWRWISAVTANLNPSWMGAPEKSFVNAWPNHLHFHEFPKLFPHEWRMAKRNNIRCMPTYPTSIEDVEKYYNAHQA